MPEELSLSMKTLYFTGRGVIVNPNKARAERERQQKLAAERVRQKLIADGKIKPDAPTPA